MDGEIARQVRPSVKMPSTLRWDMVSKQDRHFVIRLYLPTPDEAVRGVYIAGRRPVADLAAYRASVAKAAMLAVGTLFQEGEDSRVRRMDLQCIAISPWNEEDPTRGLQVPILQMSLTPTQFLKGLDHGDTELEIVEYLLRENGGWTDAAADDADDEPIWKRLKRQRQQDGLSPR